MNAHQAKNAPELARIFGVRRETIFAWLKEDNPIPRNEDKSFDLPECIAWFAERAAAQAMSKIPGADTAKEWDVRKLKAEALTKERNLEILDDEWIHRDVVERAFAERAVLVGDSLRGMDRKIAKRCPKNSREIVESELRAFAEKTLRGYVQADSPEDAGKLIADAAAERQRTEHSTKIRRGRPRREVGLK